jgi:hypothetical protein
LAEIAIAVADIEAAEADIEAAEADTEAAEADTEAAEAVVPETAVSDGCPETAAKKQSVLPVGLTEESMFQKEHLQLPWAF